jgi:hypothetical protein
MLNTLNQSLAVLASALPYALVGLGTLSTTMVARHLLDRRKERADRDTSVGVVAAEIEAVRRAVNSCYGRDPDIHTSRLLAQAVGSWRIERPTFQRELPQRVVAVVGSCYAEAGRLHVRYEAPTSDGHPKVIFEGRLMKRAEAALCELEPYRRRRSHRRWL